MREAKERLVQSSGPETESEIRELELSLALTHEIIHSTFSVDSAEQSPRLAPHE